MYKHVPVAGETEREVTPNAPPAVSVGVGAAVSVGATAAGEIEREEGSEGAGDVAREGAREEDADELKAAGETKKNPEKKKKLS